MGIAALILGIVGLILSIAGVFYWIGITLGALGIVLGAIGKSKNSSCATAGLVISIIAVAFGVIWFIVCSAMM